MNLPFIDLKSQYAEHKTNIDQAIHRVLDHGQYIMGPEVSELEQELGEYIGVKHVLACSSGTDALVLPLMAKNLGRGDAVFTSPFTFFASAESISLAGATPVFVDIDPHTYNMCPEDLKRKINATLAEGKLTPKGVMPVDLFGIAADYQQINKIANEFDLFVIEDAAQSFGAKYFDQKACSLGDFAATSFYPAKPLGCYGDGGAVFTDDTDLYETLVSLRVHGQGKTGDKYDNIQIGLNARMDTLQAAILLEKLKIFDQEVTLRNQVADRYTEKLTDSIVTPHVPENQGSVWAQYSIQVNDREKLKSDLADQGIPTAIFYPKPIHLSGAYQHLGLSMGDYPVTESIAQRIISLPMHPYLSEEMVDKICDVVNASVS